MFFIVILVELMLRVYSQWKIFPKNESNQINKFAAHHKIAKVHLIFLLG